MGTRVRHLLPIAPALAIAALPGWQAKAESNRVAFPEHIEALVRYATVTRGEVTEHMLTSREAIEAAKNGQPLPAGTHVVLADYRNGKIHRYFVMQKGEGWGADSEPRRRTGDWQFQWFWPDRSVNMNENTARCQSCHQARAESQYMFLFDDMVAFK